MKKMRRWVIFIISGLSLLVSACVSHAVPPPLLTFGGPQTAPSGGSLVGLGMGSGAELFPGAHAGGHAWFGRWRYGLSPSSEIGLDILAGPRGDKSFATFQAAFRHRVGERAAIGFGLGAADDSDGKSVGAVIGAEWRISRRTVPWSFYGALHGAGAFCLTRTQNETPRPHALYFIGALGATAQPIPWLRFIFEGGLGPVFVRGQKNIGLGIYAGCGISLDIH